jgi:hypothetical protein
MACRTGCPTKDHRSWGECARAAVPAVIGLESTNPSFTREAQRKFDNENKAYAAAVNEGLDPTGFSQREIDAAKRQADLQA